MEIDDKRQKIDDKPQKTDDKPSKTDDKPKTHHPPLTTNPKKEAFRRRKAF
nr:hypothetical protein [Planococcus salinarum]